MAGLRAGHPDRTRCAFFGGITGTSPVMTTLGHGMADATLRIEDAVNETCPWSGKPIAADALTTYRGVVVGFCNPGCRDKFETAVTQFEEALAERDTPLLAKGLD
jgi:hypothetical protein